MQLEIHTKSTQIMGHTECIWKKAFCRKIPKATK